eukprot:CAMPEP_0174274866 /NCGR_PEP_ID=MMETSP0439-20130205/59507_1 /TAXON_ID=0 /ORGANISM="Stereomyxa ramosa, Strain Chinc5" /LENGTH=266 /DNA_ID=CAMNT_0015366909 /DNA_START=84 /DNA_END=884 /DNA_ORIENTATION=+
MTWHDEFSGTDLDNTKWSIKNNESHCCDPFGQEELQLFIKEAVFLKDGMLWLQTRWNPTEGNAHGGGTKIFNYTSGDIYSTGKFYQKYGRWAANCSLPPRAAQGIWPAFWLMPQNGTCWPTGGEVDIFEYNGNPLVDWVYGSYHWALPGECGVDKEPAFGKEYRPPNSSSDWQTDFHVYAVEWFPDRLDFYVDDVLYLSRSGDKVLLPTDPMYIIFDQAVDQTIFSPKPGDPAYLGQGVFLRVDWVRVYQHVSLLQNESANPITAN